MFAVLVTRGERSCYRRLISSLTVCLSTYLQALHGALSEIGFMRVCVCPCFLHSFASDLVLMSLWTVFWDIVLELSMCDVIHAILCAAEALCESVFVCSWCVLSIVKVCLFFDSHCAVFIQQSFPVCKYCKRQMKQLFCVNTLQHRHYRAKSHIAIPWGSKTSFKSLPASSL